MKKRLLLVLLIFFLVEFLVSNVEYQINLLEYTSKQNLEREIEKYVFMSRLDTMEFSVKNLYKTLVYLEIKQPEYLIRQSWVETGGYTSELFLDYNNLFGMKNPKTRKTTSIGPTKIGGVRNYANYVHWSQSIEDMKLFQEFYEGKGWDLDNDYDKFLTELPYAIDKKYVKTVNLINVSELLDISKI